MSEGSFEAKLTAKRETKDGIFLTLSVNPDDFTEGLAMLRVNAALMIGWAETINTKVEPIEIDMPVVTTKPKAEPSKKAHKPFNDFEPSAQAAMLCGDKRFQEYLATMEQPISGIDAKENAAIYIRKYCGVKSRSELNDNEPAFKYWITLKDKYQAWLTDQMYSEVRR